MWVWTPQVHRSTCWRRCWPTRDTPTTWCVTCFLFPALPVGPSALCHWPTASVSLPLSRRRLTGGSTEPCTSWPRQKRLLSGRFEVTARQFAHGGTQGTRFLDGELLSDLACPALCMKPVSEWPTHPPKGVVMASDGEWYKLAVVGIERGLFAVIDERDIMRDMDGALIESRADEQLPPAASW